MATTIKMPQLGESVTEGTIERWLVKEGDTVEQYDPLFEVVTDKVNAEVPAEVAGTITKIIVGDGQTVKVGTPLAEIEAGDGAGAAEGNGQEPAQVAEQPVAAAEAPQQEASTPAEAPAPAEAPTPPQPQAAAAPPEAAAQASAPAQPTTEAPGAEAAPAQAAAQPQASAEAQAQPQAEQATAEAGGGATDGSTRMTPAVRRLVRENNVDVAQIQGTGAAGRVTRDDVLGFVASRASQPAASAQQAAAPAPTAGAAEPAAQASAQAPTAASAQPAAPPASQASPSFAPTPVPPPSGGDTEIPLSQMRKGIAAKMTRVKQTVPHAYTVVEVDMGNVVRWREANTAAYKTREGIGISYVAVVIKAVTETLRQHPMVNSQFAEDRVILKQAMNIGIAVAVDNGLLVPVIHNADQLSISGVNRQVQDLAGRARSNKLRLEDIQGGTFTVNNTGWFGSVTSMPIINAPEVAILSMEAIVKRPMVIEVDGADVIAIRPMMNMTCSFDHRVLDGAQVGYFLADIRKRLEAWDFNTPIG
jgi:2-oxoisovalerate dehydrogenase E2 component (dihydrolipoyl transacylase)